MYFSIKNSRLIISSKILGGNNNFKIIGFPTLNNKLTLVNDNIFKIKDIYWQINIDNIWKSVHKGNKYITNKEYIGNELRVLISYFCLSICTNKRLRH